MIAGVPCGTQAEALKPVLIRGSAIEQKRMYGGPDEAFGFR